jgi:hypothetical protein
MSGYIVSLLADREASVDHELAVANMQVAPVPICLASPRGLKPARRLSGQAVLRGQLA